VHIAGSLVAYERLKSLGERCTWPGTSFWIIGCTFLVVSHKPALRGHTVTFFHSFLGHRGRIGQLLNKYRFEEARAQIKA
jgi:hypothetical protein